MSGGGDYKGIFLGKLVGLSEVKRGEFLSKEIFGVQMRRVEGVKLFPFLRMRGRMRHFLQVENLDFQGGNNAREEHRQRVIGELENKFKDEKFEGVISENDGFGGLARGFYNDLGLEELGGYDFWGDSN